MATKRHKPEEIVSKLRQVDVLVGQVQARIDAIRQVQITEQTYYRWRKQYGGMGTDQLKELKRLQKETSVFAGLFPISPWTSSYCPRLPGETSKPRTAAQLH